MPWRRALVRAGFVLAMAAALQAQGRWYPPYDRGVKAVEAGRWNEAIQSLEQALTIDSRPGANKYVEGVFRSDYFPHAYLAIACLGAGQHDKAKAYLDRARQDRLPAPLAARLATVEQELDKVRRAPPAGKPTTAPPAAEKLNIDTGIVKPPPLCARSYCA
jgi:tetratricopeptide (TPR) repeat protein